MSNIDRGYFVDDDSNDAFAFPGLDTENFRASQTGSRATELSTRDGTTQFTSTVCIHGVHFDFRVVFRKQTLQHLFLYRHNDVTVPISEAQQRQFAHENSDWLNEFIGCDDQQYQWGRVHSFYSPQELYAIIAAHYA